MAKKITIRLVINRKDQGSEKVVEEIADTIIRLLDLYAAMRNEEFVLHSLDDVLQNKIDKNKLRPPLHGNRF